METIRKNLGTVVAVVLIVAGVVFYNNFIKTEVIVIPSEEEASRIGNEVLGFLEELRAVTLDQSLFAAPSYKLLTDFSVEIQPQPLGRPNPFDIIGRDQ